HFHVVIATCLEICFKTTRNILEPRISVGALKQIGYLAAQRLRSINGVPAEGDGSKEILLPFVNWNDHIDFVTFRLKFIKWLIDYRVHKPFGNIKPVH